MTTTSTSVRGIALPETSGGERRQPASTAAATVTATNSFDGATLVDGPANHPRRRAPIIRVETET
jgi:hypothetical protein